MIRKGSYRSPMVGWAFAPYAREYEHSSIAITAASAGVGTGGSTSAVSSNPNSSSSRHRTPSSGPRSSRRTTWSWTTPPAWPAHGAGTASPA